MLVEVSKVFRDSDLFGIDLSSEFASRFAERQRAGEFGGLYVHFFHRNLLDPIFDPASIDTTICNSTLHELWSYGEGERSVRHYLREKYRQLRPGGRLVIRDVVGPENGDTMIFLKCRRDDGTDLTDHDLELRTDRPADWISGLSTRAKFLLFARDFRAAYRGDSPLFFEIREDGFITTLRNVAEFLTKKDYADNWQSEMNEEFCFWSFAHWKQVLRDTGFSIIEDAQHPQGSSRTYTNKWIVKHRYQEHLQLLNFDPKHAGEVVAWPPTNMILIGEKKQP